MGLSGVATLQKGQPVLGISEQTQKLQTGEGGSPVRMQQRPKKAEPPATQQEPQKIEEQKLEKVAKAMENFIRSIQRDLKIKVHKETGRLMVQVISAEDGKVVREIPPEELLNLAAKMEEMVGILFETEA